MTLEVSALTPQIKEILGSMAEEISPWFFANMHPYYFRFHPEEEIKKHILAIISGRLTTDKGIISLESPCGTRFTFITPGENKSALIKILEDFKEKKIQTVRMYTSLDGSICLSTFQTYKQVEDLEIKEELNLELDNFFKEKIIKPEEKEEFSSFISCANSEYLTRLERGRVARHFKILKSLRGKEEVYLNIEPEVYAEESRITIAMNNPPSYGLLLEIIKIFFRHNLNINRLYLDTFYNREEDITSLIISCYLKCTAKELEKDSCLLNLQEDLSLVKWFFPDELEWFAQEKSFSVKKVFLLQASSEFAHQYLLKIDPYAYTQARIKAKLIAYPEITEELVDYFYARFSPQEESREDLMAVRELNLKKSLVELTDEIAKNVFESILLFYKNILRTNYFFENLFGLSFRLDPKVFASFIKDEEIPFGIYYFYGRFFIGFHIRYRDMARGGVRVVRTKNLEHYKMELHRVFDEARGLALAQQYKNKDIPEGGSKAVILLHPLGDIDLAVKAMADSLLDLIVSSKDSPCKENIVDYLKRHELIYLGPDENISPKHINWIVQRAREKGYSWPQAIMSSKPVAGINHKQYGVTSLGVVVYMEEVLKFLGLNPYEQEFSVKLTGGPAGDVAGNALKLIIQNYGSKARILSLSDGHGCLYDPSGLDHEELLRLVKEEKPTSEFSPARLKSKEAFLVKADTPEGVKIRNELHNKVVADVFLPCGGRPDTINLKNWAKFLTPEGKPSAQAIIEGANLFISPEAREKLQEKGVLIIHGSSANKAGVISSSYEILAGLILNEQEFLELKDEYIKEVLEILGKRARDEARLLLWEYKLRSKKEFLTKISLEVSREINELSDIISSLLTEKVGDLSADDLLQEQVLEYCPFVLVSRYKKRILTDTPARYRFSLLGAYLASKLVYKEGLSWAKRIKELEDLYGFLRLYLQKNKKIKNYVQELANPEVREIVEQMGSNYLALKEFLH